MKLYGSRTSPFVRRARVVAQEVGVWAELVDTATDAGQAALRRLSPIWKVPIAEIDERLLFDSHLICEYLLHRQGGARIRMPSEDQRWHEANVMSVIDSAVESAIEVFVMKRDKVDTSGIPYLIKQGQRVRSTMEWLERELKDQAWFEPSAHLGLPEIALFTSLEWMSFRDVFSTDQSPLLKHFVEVHKDRDSFASTRPGA